jgi:hypothetical protein
MLKYIYIICLILGLLYGNAICDFLSDKTMRGVVDRGWKDGVVSSMFNADSNGTYQSKVLLIQSSDPNINWEWRLITNFAADYDSVTFDRPLLVAPSVGDSIFVMPIFGVWMADVSEVTDSNRKAILAAPYTPIKTNLQGMVQTMGDMLLGAFDGSRIRYFPSNRNPKDSAHIVNPALGADSIIFFIKYDKVFNVISVQEGHER